MLLYLEPPAFGLPTADPECVAALAYCIATIPDAFQVDYTATKSSLITETLPSLHDTASGIWLSGFRSIERHLKKLGLDHDTRATSAARAESIALTHLMRSQAHDLMLLYLFEDAENYEVFNKTTLTSTWLSRFPLTLLATNDTGRQRRARIQELLEREHQEPSTIFKSKQSEAIQHKARQMKLLGMADQIYSVLEASLSNRPYLLGTKPTSIDCIVFGHLSLHLFPDVPNDFLAKRIQESFPRTWRYLVDLKELLLDQTTLDIVQSPSISAREYCNSFLYSIIDHKPRSNPKETTQSSHDEKKEDWSKKIAFGGSVLAVLGTFIWANQLIVVDFVDE